MFSEILVYGSALIIVAISVVNMVDPTLRSLESKVLGSCIITISATSILFFFGNGEEILKQSQIVREGVSLLVSISISFLMFGSSMVTNKFAR